MVSSIERDGVKVGYGVVIMPPTPDPTATPPRSADDATIRAEIAELLEG